MSLLRILTVLSKALHFFQVFLTGLWLLGVHRSTSVLLLLQGNVFAVHISSVQVMYSPLLDQIF